MVKLEDGYAICKFAEHEGRLHKIEYYPPPTTVPSNGLLRFFFCGLLLIILVCTSDTWSRLLLYRDVSSSLVWNSTYSPPWTLRSPFQYIPEEIDLALPDNLSNKLPLCFGKLGEEGEWIYAPESVQSWLKYEVWGECIKTSRFNCNKKYHKFGVTDKASIEVRMKEANKWMWRPNSCIYDQLNPESFIRRMNGKTLLFVGDSLTETAFESLTCQLWQYVVEKVNLRDKFPSSVTDLCNEFSRNVTAEARAHPEIDETFFSVSRTKEIGLVCAGWGHYMYAELDDGSWVKSLMVSAPYLGAAAEYVDRLTGGGHTRLETWWGYLLNQFGVRPNILILNVGMHFSFNRPTFNSSYEMGRLALSTQMVLSKIFNGKVIWRSNYQPIWECINVTKPLKDYREYNAHPEWKKFNWEELELYNKLWQAAWRKSELPLYLLDIRPFTLFPLGRRDMERDCVHSCLPGPFDRWAGDWFWTILQAIT